MNTNDLLDIMTYDEWDLYPAEREAIRAIIAERDRLRAALEKYADERNWDYLLITKEDLSQASFLCWIGEKRPHAVARSALAKVQL